MPRPSFAFRRSHGDWEGDFYTWSCRMSRRARWRVWTASRSSATCPIACRSGHLRRSLVVAEERFNLRGRTSRKWVREERNEQVKILGGFGGLGFVEVHRIWGLTSTDEAELRGFVCVVWWLSSSPEWGKREREGRGRYRCKEGYALWP